MGGNQFASGVQPLHCKWDVHAVRPDWRIVHRAQLDLLPLSRQNGGTQAVAIEEIGDTCIYLTLPAAAAVLSGLKKKAYNAILERLATAVPCVLQGKVRVDRAVLEIRRRKYEVGGVTAEDVPRREGEFTTQLPASVGHVPDPHGGRGADCQIIYQESDSIPIE